MYSTDSNSDKIMTMKNNAEPAEPFNSQDLIVNSPFWLLQISKQIGSENLEWDQDSDFYLTSLSILITCLLDNVWMP